MKKQLISALLSAFIPLSAASSYGTDKAADYPEGWLLWHSYSDYSAMDSRLYLRTPDGSITEISGNFRHPMNACFGSSPADILFMAIDTSADEWDIYRYNAVTGQILNLTENSGFRNEDAKFSPDGRKIVFKRGHWDGALDDFKYDLAELDTVSGSVRRLTDDTAEEAMPCYSADGRYVYFARYIGGIGEICRLDMSDDSVKTIYSEENVTAYYPVTYNDDVYFTKWHSAENRNDMIMRYADGETSPMPFCTADTNCSDACPVGENSMIYSCTAAGSYDLYLYDGASSYPLPDINTARNELGAAFYPMARYEDYLADMADFLLGTQCPDIDYDINGDGKADAYDLIYARKLNK